MKSILLSIAALLSFSAFANSVLLPVEQYDVVSADAVEKGLDADFLTITQVELTELRSEDFSLDDLISVDAYLKKIIDITDTLIALGNKVWPLIEKGRPVINTNFKDAISVIPNINNGGTAFNELSGWAAPISRKYSVGYKNAYGVEVVNFVFSVNAQYGGQYEGKGQYLTGVTIVPNTIEVAWGFDFNASSSMINITNRGTKADPIAAVTLEVDYRTKTVLKESRVKTQFHISGDGKIIQIN